MATIDNGTPCYNGFEPINPNDPAMPWNSVETLRPNQSGLSIRSELAARAMQGLLSNRSINSGSETWDYICRASVACADALINELNKES